MGHLAQAQTLTIERKLLNFYWVDILKVKQSFWVFVCHCQASKREIDYDDKIKKLESEYNEVKNLCFNSYT